MGLLYGVTGRNWGYTLLSRSPLLRRTFLFIETMVCSNLEVGCNRRNYHGGTAAVVVGKQDGAPERCQTQRQMMLEQEEVLQPMMIWLRTHATVLSSQGSSTLRKPLLQLRQPQEYGHLVNRKIAMPRNSKLIFRKKQYAKCSHNERLSYVK